VVDRQHGRRAERGSAVVDFVLVVVVLVPLFLGIVQVGLVLHVRNTLTSAAAAGARYGATVDRPVPAGVSRTRQQISTAVAARFASDVRGSTSVVNGVPTVRVEVVAEVPPLGLWGPAVRLDVAGHAVQEQLP
jgi:Flp pilus assembly protein TadG